MNLPESTFLTAYPQAQRASGEYLIQCHEHLDQKPSLSVNLTKQVWRCLACRASGHLSQLPEIRRLHKVQDRPSRKARAIPENLVATYDYVDEEGKILHQTLRYEEPEREKTFRQRGKPNGHWENTLENVRTVLYNLPAVVAAERVLVVEGEKDADALNDLGLVATTAPMGAGSWKPEYDDFLAGKDVVLVPDNDEAGRRHAEKIALGLRDRAKTRLLLLPGLPPKGDVSDFLQDDTNVSRLFNLIEEAAAYQPEPEPDREGLEAEIGDGENLTKHDELVLFIQRHRTRCPSFLEIRKGLRISDSRLSNLIAKDRRGDRHFRTLSDGRAKYLTLRKGSGLKATHSSCVEPLPREIGAHLPANFHDFLGTNQRGLKPKSFVCFCADGDVGKTQFLINCAIENARRGLRVAFVQHEDDAEGFYRSLARRFLNRNPTSFEEAREAVQRSGIEKFLTLYIAEGEVQINEFLEEIEEKAPDVVIYDYLSQEHMEIDLPEQRSVLTRIVMTFGEHLVDRGTPVITALHLERGKDGKYHLNSRWERRFNVDLWAISREVTPEGLITTLQVMKNKQGGLVKWNKLEMVTDLDSWEVREVRLPETLREPGAGEQFTRVYRPNGVLGDDARGV